MDADNSEYVEGFTGSRSTATAGSGCTPSIKGSFSIIRGGFDEGRRRAELVFIEIQKLDAHEARSGSVGKLGT
jgi:hypothetical protein